MKKSESVKKYKKEINEQIDKTVDKILNDESFDGADWHILRFLVNKRFLFGTKRLLRIIMLQILYSTSIEDMDEEMKFTKLCFERQGMNFYYVAKRKMVL